MKNRQQRRHENHPGVPLFIQPSGKSSSGQKAVKSRPKPKKGKK